MDSSSVPVGKENVPVYVLIFYLLLYVYFLYDFILNIYIYIYMNAAIAQPTGQRFVANMSNINDAYVRCTSSSKYYLAVLVLLLLLVLA